MAEPARECADGTGALEPRRSDPLSPGWANVCGLLAAAAESAALAVTELAARPDCPAALRRVELLRAALRDLTEITRRCAVDETVLKLVRAEAYEKGVADCKAARCRLEAVPDPR